MDCKLLACPQDISGEEEKYSYNGGKPLKYQAWEAF
jgi:hypothetical protein